MSVQPGELNQFITVQKKVRTPSDMGGFDSTWEDLKCIWAQILPIAAKEAEDADRPVSAQKFKVTIYNDSTINASHRIKWGGYYLNIISPRYRGPEALFLVLDCESGAAS